FSTQPTRLRARFACQICVVPSSNNHFRDHPPTPFRRPPPAFPSRGRRGRLQEPATIPIGKVIAEFGRTTRRGVGRPTRMSIAPWGAVEARTQQHQSDEAMGDLRRVNRTLMTLSAGNRALLHATREHELVQNMCRTIVEVGGYRMAWAAHAERDGEKRVE